MFEGVNWLAVGVGFVASFGFGWFYYGPKGFYPAWSASAGVKHQQGDPMGAAFGSLTLGLILGIVTFIVMGYSNNAFKKLGATSRAIDAGSWAASGVLMLLVQALL